MRALEKWKGLVSGASVERETSGRGGVDTASGEIRELLMEKNAIGVGQKAMPKEFQTDGLHFSQWSEGISYAESQGGEGEAEACAKVGKFLKIQ